MSDRSKESTPPKLSDRYDARAQLRSSVDALADRANLYTQMQKDPLKMIGGASGVGLVLGLLVGRRFARTRKIYVHEDMSKKEQKAYAKLQQRLHKGERGAKKGGIGGALMAALTTVAIRVVQERVLKPQVERFADQMSQRAQQGQAQQRQGGASATTEHDPRRM